jgi:4-hydroxy-tetrahydrodipicolinate synthase
MTVFEPGLVHTPLTPFKSDSGVDFETYGKLIDFHIANGADAIAVPMHVGESVSLRDAEKRDVIAYAVERSAGRVPVIAHASDAGTSIAAALAAFAQKVGAAAIVSSTPYYWTPPPAMMVEHFAAIASAVSIPFLVHNAPEEMSGVKVNTQLMLQLVERAENFAGVVDSGLDWQFMIELLTDVPKLRPDFRLISGNEYMVSASAIGARSLFSPLAGVAPKMIRSMFDNCVADRLFEARKSQEAVAALRHALKASAVAGLKAVTADLGRDCGVPRPPLEALAAPEATGLCQEITRIPGLADEPRGW